MIKRQIQQDINKYINEKDNKIFFIWGPRRSGKTTIIRHLGKQLSIKVFNFDFLDERDFFVPKKATLDILFNSPEITTKDNKKIILIDEVQNYPEATLALKLLHDEYDVKIIATGSSELKQTTNDFDSLSGRYTTNYCLPLSLHEAINSNNVSKLDLSVILQKNFNKQIAYGFYPEIYSGKITNFEKQNLLYNIIDTYVLKDIINIYQLKNLKLAKNILKKIALQLGQEVSLREIGDSLKTNVVTVSNYIEIFIKNYILIELPSFKTNMRRAISQNKKYYFYDIGLRNALIKDFRKLDLRQDKGAVFENYIITEVEKIKKSNKTNFSTYFYREYSGKELDLIIEDYQKKYHAFDIKLSKNISSVNKIFPLEHKLGVINKLNYFQFFNKLKNFK